MRLAPLARGIPGEEQPQHGEQTDKAGHHDGIALIGSLAVYLLLLLLGVEAGGVEMGLALQQTVAQGLAERLVSLA